MNFHVPEASGLMKKANGWSIFKVTMGSAGLVERINLNLHVPEALGLIKKANVWA